ncbi:hypothetical protein MC885_015076 [Smutsia gigantea]|nr:hypothetical protein MC885_015076 [Smutsia gigantea]
MGSLTGARESMIPDTGSGGWSVVSTAPSPILYPSQAQPISHYPSPNPWLSAPLILTVSTADLQMEASPTQGMNSTSELGKVWEKLFRVIPRPSVSHFDLYRQTCALVGNSEILQALGLGNIMNHHPTAFRFKKMVWFLDGMGDSKDQDADFGFGSEEQGKGFHYWEDVNKTYGSKEILPMPSMEAELEVSDSVMNQAPVQGFEMDMGNKTTIHIMYPEIACTEDPGTQLLLLPLNSSGLKWFMKVMQKQDNVLVTSLTFSLYVQNHWLGVHGQLPSLVFMALLYALHTCDQAWKVAMEARESPNLNGPAGTTPQACHCSQDLQLHHDSMNPVDPTGLTL